MSDFHILEDQAVLYVTGQLTPAERREFEVRLAESAELRTLVHELEEGAVTLAMASPRRRPPQQIWKGIEKIVSGETKGQAIPAFWVGWWRNGWAAAAACLIGWLFYALWINHTNQVASSTLDASDLSSQQGTKIADSHRIETRGSTPRPRTETNASRQLHPVDPQVKATEIGALRWRILELENQVTHLSQVLTQQQTLLAEPSRLKFFQLASAPDGSLGTNAVALSPKLQRALFLAMARELGWSQPADATSDTGTENKQSSQSSTSTSTQTNQTGVDFVDLRTDTNGTANPANFQPHIESEPAGTLEPPSLASSSSNAIPGFLSGTNAFLAFDPSMMASGYQLTFWGGTASQWSQPIGTAVIGNNPLVVTVPFATLPGWNLTVTGGATNSGSFNFIGVYPPPGTTSP